MVQVAETMLAVDTVPNPAEYAERIVHPTIKVVRTLRNDPIGIMRAKGQIDEAQYAAAREWQRLAEAAGPRLKSSGHLEEPVDGGGFTAATPSENLEDWKIPKPLQHQLNAQKKLIHYAALLGPRQHRLLVLVLEQGVSAWGATAALFPLDLSHERRRFVGTWFQEILSILARDMKLAS